MPMNFGVSKEDLLRSKVVPPTWYLCTVKNISQGPGTNDPSSTTTTIELIIKDAPDKQYLGVPLRYWLSEKAAGLSVAFLEAVSGKKIPDGGLNLDLAACIGRDVKVYVTNEKYRNRLQNVCQDFAPVQQ